MSFPASPEGGKPCHHKSLAHFALDKGEKERLEKIAGLGSEYSTILAETYHYADILNMFSSTQGYTFTFWFLCHSLLW